jgi:hypothetical protein
MRHLLLAILIVTWADCDSTRRPVTGDANRGAGGDAAGGAGGDAAAGDRPGPELPWWPPRRCEPVGRLCNSHDPCVPEARCGSDGRCWPTKIIDCNDRLYCTWDVCVGNFLCDNPPKEGWCVLPVQRDGGLHHYCFRTGARHPGDPCLICDPDRDPTTWTRTC